MFRRRGPGLVRAAATTADGEGAAALACEPCSQVAPAPPIAPAAARASTRRVGVRVLSCMIAPVKWVGLAKNVGAFT